MTPGNSAEDKTLTTRKIAAGKNTWAGEPVALQWYDRSYPEPMRAASSLDIPTVAIGVWKAVDERRE